MDSTLTRKRRRTYGEHLTPTTVFETYILPDILPNLRGYRWVDLFAGKGNLIFPILEQIEPLERADFFEYHIRLYDIQSEMVEYCIQRAVQLGIPETLARQHIRQQDTLAHYPTEILESPLPVWHVTNPPYLYIGYIVKHPETQRYLEYFKGLNDGYQDLYQIALINDLRHGIQRMTYIIPSNFLFGFSNANKIRDDFLPLYYVRKALIFEKDLFEHTGVHVAICFFERKPYPKREPQEFIGVKINHTAQERRYHLSPQFHYRAGSEFEEFVQTYRARRPLKVRYYLMEEELQQHQGEHAVCLVDANAFDGKAYRKFTANVDATLSEQIRQNPLFVRTLDTGSDDGRAGLYFIPEVFGADGIVVTKATYRTHPIQLFLEPSLPMEDLRLLKDYVNLLLEYFRALTDSEFLTTYKYSESAYTRKYLGLSQVKALIETFPILEITPHEKERLCQLVAEGNAEAVIEMLKHCGEGGDSQRTWKCAGQADRRTYPVHIPTPVT